MKKNNGYVLKTSRPGCVVHGMTLFWGRDRHAGSEPCPRQKRRFYVHKNYYWVPYFYGVAGHRFAARPAGGLLYTGHVPEQPCIFGGLLWGFGFPPN